MEGQTNRNLPLPPEIRNPVVLIVEPDQQVRTMLARLLTRAQFTALEAGDALEALLIASVPLTKIDALVTEMDLKNISGPEFAEIFVSVHGETRVLFVGGATGSHPTLDLIAKPFRPSLIVNRLRLILNLPTAQADTSGAQLRETSSLKQPREVRRET